METDVTDEGTPVVSEMMEEGLVIEALLPDEVMSLKTKMVVEGLVIKAELTDK